MFFDDRTRLSRGARDRAARRGTIRPARRGRGPDRHARAHAAAGGRHRGDHRRRVLGEPAPRGRATSRKSRWRSCRRTAPTGRCSSSGRCRSPRWRWSRSRPPSNAPASISASGGRTASCACGARRRHIPIFCLVLEVVAPGLLVIKHHRGEVRQVHQRRRARRRSDQDDRRDGLEPSGLPVAPRLAARLRHEDLARRPQRARRAGGLDPGARPRRVAAGRAGGRARMARVDRPSDFVLGAAAVLGARRSRQSARRASRT